MTYPQGSPDQNAYGQQPYGQNAYGQNVPGQNAYGQQQFSPQADPAANYAGEPPLCLPARGIGMGGAMSRFFNKAFRFHGRASRSEYWWATLGLTLIGLVLGFASGVIGGATSSSGGEPSGAAFIPMGLLVLFLLATIIPSLSVTIRRLHDAGFSGWWYLISLVPFGGLVVLVMTILESAPEKMKAEWEDPEALALWNQPKQGFQPNQFGAGQFNNEQFGNGQYGNGQY